MKLQDSPMLIGSQIVFFIKSESGTGYTHSFAAFHNTRWTLIYSVNTDIREAIFKAPLLHRRSPISTPNSVLVWIRTFEFKQLFATALFVQLDYQFHIILQALGQVLFFPFHRRHGQMRIPMRIFAQPQDFSSSLECFFPLIPFKSVPELSPRFTVIVNIWRSEDDMLSCCTKGCTDPVGLFRLFERRNQVLASKCRGPVIAS